MVSRPLIPILLFSLSVLAGARVFERTRADRLRLTFFDVGQGDAALIEFPGGTTWLVDAGGGFGEFDEGARVLFPELARRGILHLDVAFLTHPDRDHALGFRGLFGNLSIGELWMSEAVFRSGNPLLKNLLVQAGAQSTYVRDFVQEEDRNLSGVHAQILPINAGEDSNDRPLLLQLEYAGCRALLAADAEAPTEAALAAHPHRAIDLLKVAHHGSNTSSTNAFLRAFSPRWAVISVGEGNMYHHPHPRAVDRLRRADAHLLRTDFHGYLQFTFTPDGRAHCESAVGDCGQSRCNGG